MKMKKCISIILGIAMILSTMTFVSAKDLTVVDNEKDFQVTVVDKGGNPISNADIYLYSFLDGKIVGKGNTDTNGNEQYKAKAVYRLLDLCREG